MARKNRKNETVKSPQQRAAAWYGEVQQAADTAAYGEVLDDAETATIDGGRRVMQDIIEVTMMKKVREEQEKKSRICTKDGCGGDIRHRGNKKNARDSGG